MRLRRGNESGSTFLTTMICVFIATLSGSFTMKAAAIHTHYANELRKSTQALQVAEAGLALALSTVRSNWSSISGAMPSGSLGNGTFSTTVSSSGGRYLLKTTGTVQSHSRTASAEVTGPSSNALNYMFAAGGNADIDPGTGQSSGTISGNIYAAGNVGLNGPSGGTLLTVTGNVYANGSTTTGSSVSVSGSTQSSWPQTESFPAIDYAYYQNIASSNGLYYSSDRTYASGTLPASPAGGVIYVNGNVTIRGTQSTTACIIATGNIQIEKSGSTYPRVTVNQYSNFPAILTQGNLQFSSNGNGGAYLDATGLVYAGGNIQLSSGNHDTFTFTGSVVARGNIQTTGLTAWNTLTATYVAQTPPGITGGGNSTPEIVSYNG